MDTLEQAPIKYQPITGQGSQTCYPSMHKHRQAIPACTINMHCIKEAVRAQNIGQADTENSCQTRETYTEE